MALPFARLAPLPLSMAADATLGGNSRIAERHQDGASSMQSSAEHRNTLSQQPAKQSVKNIAQAGSTLRAQMPAAPAPDPIFERETEEPFCLDDFTKRGKRGAKNASRAASTQRQPAKPKTPIAAQRRAGDHDRAAAEQASRVESMSAQDQSLFASLKAELEAASPTPSSK